MKRILLLTVALIATLQVFAQDVQYLDADGNKQTASSGSYTKFTSQTTLNGGWYVLDSNVTLDSRIYITGTVHLILTDGHTLTAKKGICLIDNNELDIYGQGGGTGTLNATGGDNCAGIGGDNHQHAGTLIVNGGKVNATAGYSAAGIGGGAQGYWKGDYGHGGTVIINGGAVTASGSGYGAGIGGGGNHKFASTAIPGKGGTVIINGGQVSATGGSNGGYGIGPGRSSGNEGDTGTLSLGWRNSTDRIFMSSVKATVTLKSEFVYEDTKEAVTADNLDGRTIIPSDTSAPSDPKLKGDVNDDGRVDISDIVAAINHIAGSAVFARADVNDDLSVDISDIVMVINIIANGIKEYEDEDTDPAVTHGLCPDSNHPHAINLVNGMSFSCCNVGASAPWEFGGYYAWGETEEKSEYYWDNYKYGTGYNDPCVDIGHNIARTQYDVAHVLWGGKWQMPNIEQLTYLCDECSSKWVMLKGVKGILYTGPNGNSVFFPASGDRRGRDLYDVGNAGIYAASEISGEDNTSIWVCHLNLEYNTDDFIWTREEGFSVRPVIEPEDWAMASGWCPDTKHPHIIDMGDAGKWACCNIGASNPLEFGSYYAWGETEEKKNYDWSTYKHYDGNSDTCHDLGSDISGTVYDVAHMKWGGAWHMPSREQCNLLNNCTNKWITINGITGRKYTSSNGNTIFMPSKEGLWSDSYDCDYWSSTLSQWDSRGAYVQYISFNYTNCDGYTDRSRGLHVRPVTK